MDWTSIVIAAVSGGALLELVRYLLGGRKKSNLDIMQTELGRMDQRVARLERLVERYEMREAIFASATSCAHKCQVPDEECPVLIYMDKNQLPDKQL